MQFKTESIIPPLSGWDREAPSPLVALVPPAPLKPAASDTFHLASPRCIRSTALSHPILDFTRTRVLHANHSFSARAPCGSRPKPPAEPSLLSLQPGGDRAAPGIRCSALRYSGAGPFLHRSAAVPARPPSAPNRRATQARLRCRRAYL